MLNPISSHAINLPAHTGRRPATGAHSEASPDRVTIMGMPDPSKYPDWKPGRRDPHIIGMPDPAKYPNYNRDLTCGGWDAPMLHNGRVISRHEFAHRGDLGQA